MREEVRRLTQGWLRATASGRTRDDLSAELFERPEQIRGAPPFGDLATGEPHDVKCGDLDLPVGRRNSQKRTSLGASPEDVPRHQVPLCQHGLDAAVEVRERR